MRIIPVFDLKGGVVVHGVAGRRNEYQPVKSLLTVETDPGTLAAAMVDGFHVDRCYIADLDAIAGRTANWPAIRKIAASGLVVMLDVGISSAAQASEYTARVAGSAELSAELILGLESCPGPSELRNIVETLCPAGAIFSLDLNAGSPLTNSPAWQEFSPEEIAAIAVEAGIQRLIVLDVAKVGTRCGPATLPLCRKLRTTYPAIELITGGGVRDVDDLAICREAGCDAVLVASALHDGSLTPRDLDRFGAKVDDPTARA